MYLRRTWGWVLFLFIAAGAFISAYGEPMTQEITLQPGWNAIYLLVQPDPPGCDEIFNGIPIKSVWTWNKRFSSVQYVRDPSTLAPTEEEWLVYFPKDGFNSFLTTFRALIGGKSYLVELQGDKPITLTLNGEAVAEKTQWLSNSFNLAGFSVDPENEPTFAAYFEPAKELADQPSYRLGNDGRWRLIENKQSEVVHSGEAYLIHCEGSSTYSGPLVAAGEMPEGLEFGQDIESQTLTLKNETATPKTVTLTLAPSGEKSAEDAGTAAGGVVLYYKPLLAWRPMDVPIQVTLQPKSKGQIELAVRRAEMAEPDSADATFESTLKITDGAGTLINMPVTAQKAINDAGLYVGLVVIDAVSEAGALDSVTPKATASSFRFRLIVHKDDHDPPKVNLLQHVTVMQVQPSTVSDPQNPGQEIVVPARYVLLADDSLIPNYTGVSLRDGEIVGRRISTPVFSFQAPVELVKDGSNANVYTGSISTPYNDPLNPFLHRYHPDHNNLNEYYEPFTNAGGTDVSDGVESYSFTRTVRLTFTEDDPENLGEIAWGYNLIGGTYEEKISGVHKKDIYIKGTFRLNRILSVTRLDDEL